MCRFEWGNANVLVCRTYEKGRDGLRPFSLESGRNSAQPSLFHDFGVEILGRLFDTFTDRQTHH